MMHDLARQFRLLRRHAAYSRLRLGADRERAVEAALGDLYRGVNAWLRSLGVDYWLAYGTLLGWHRCQGILRGDRDVDFGLPEGAHEAVWKGRRALPEGCVLHDTSARHGGPKLYVEHRGWEADLYFYREAEGMLRLHLKSDLPGEREPMPVGFVYPLRPAEFLGQPTLLPNDVQACLEHYYGYIGEDAVLDRATGYWRPR